jgi:cytochrome b561
MTALQADAGHYSRVARWLHWAMAIMIIGNLVGGLLHDVDPALIMPLHKASGITLLFLTLLRFGWRLTHRPPAFPASMANWERWASTIAHNALYALMILVPLTGWLMSSAGSRPLTWFGLFDIPKLPVEQSEAFGEMMSERHEVLAFAMIGLLVIHLAAALRHHFIKKDGMLARMLG